jgi:glycine betaine/choline ABC-type transport system substrate-binding protein
MDRNLLYRALTQESIDLAAGDSTDGRVAAFDLVQLDDDRRYFPPYQAVPLVRAETLRRYPELRDALNLLAGKIDAAAMRQMNRQVDQERKKPEEVAHSFLRGKGLLPKD